VRLEANGDKTASKEHARRLVSELKELGCIRSQPVADAFASIPRERFVPPMALDRVYRVDEAIPTRFDEDGVPISSSSAPRIMAVMLEMLEVQAGQAVLEVGVGTGYNAALLANLAGAEGSVTSIDIDSVVAGLAGDHLATAEVTGVEVVIGDGWHGQPGNVFERAIVTAECWDISPSWVEQLPEGGILVLPLWLRPGLTLAVAFQKKGSGLVSRSEAFCGFMPLRGPHGGPPRRALLATVPWEVQAGPGGPRWLAVLDEATEERVGRLRDVLAESATVDSTPSTFPGWNARLALEEPDPIVFTTLFPPLRTAFGLFDAELPSLAVLSGEAVWGCGDRSCRDRLLAFLSRRAPLDLAETCFFALPHGTAPPSVALTVIRRPSFDIVALQGSESPRPV
jgi:protein-L-isoaspartate(D-aspartate) O-methyltransferase